MAAMRIVSLALIMAGALSAFSQPQQSVPARKDARGLLRIDPSFYEVAAATGGDFYFWAPGEFATSNLQIPIHGESVVLSYGKVEGKRTFDVPVEQGVRELTIFTGLQRKDLVVVTRPDGTPLKNGDAGTSFQSFQHMTIATVKTPPAGMWQVEIHGAGSYAMTAHVKSAEQGPEMVSFQFLEEGGRPGHEGLFPLKRNVKAGESHLWTLELGGVVSDVEMIFVAEDGSPVARFEVVPLEGSDDYSGSAVIPAVPFRVMATGRTRDGSRFQRVDSPLITP